MKRTIRFTELYYDDAERLSQYLAQRDGKNIELVNGLSTYFPLPPKGVPMPDKVNIFKVGNYEIAYLTHRTTPDEDLKHRNRTLYRVMLGEQLQKARLDKGLSLQEVEKATGYRAKNIENIEYGRYDASINIIGSIAHALDVKIAFIPFNS